MWLLHIFPRFARFAVGTFYRFTVSGERVPAEGPVLILANHPNSLMDPGLVAAAAGRPIRFLAKAPLFQDRWLGWAIRGSGSIPVYRRSDDPTAMDRNEDMFRAVHQALAEGSAVGMFPEGLSHSEPALAPLKTGAARIALGAARLIGGAFPIVPIGLTFRRKQVFRSETLALIGEPVGWDDLAGRAVEDVEAVRELTDRIAEALREVTLNLERWEDADLVEGAEAIFAAEVPVEPGPAARVERLRATTETLARLRREEHGDWAELAEEVERHLRLLRVLGMTPAALKASIHPHLAAGWVLRNLAFFLLGAPLALLGILVYWLPYRATGIAEARLKAPQDTLATFKTLVGGLIHVGWTILIGLVVWWRWGWIAGVATLLAPPLIGLVTIRVMERWRRAVGELRRFLLRTRRAETIAEMRARQREIAQRLLTLWERVRPLEPV